MENPYNQPTNIPSQQRDNPYKNADPFTIVAFLVALGLTLWSEIGEHWPTDWLIEKQADLFDGSYYVKLTFVLTLLIWMLPLIGVAKVIKRMVMKK